MPKTELSEAEIVRLVGRLRGDDIKQHRATRAYPSATDARDAADALVELQNKVVRLSAAIERAYHLLGHSRT